MSVIGAAIAAGRNENEFSVLFFDFLTFLSNSCQYFWGAFENVLIAPDVKFMRALLTYLEQQQQPLPTYDRIS